MPERVEVSIGIIERQGKLLICQRPPHAWLGGLWEFPGGKQLPGESPRQCLTRELLEELSINVHIVEELELIEHDYPHASIRIHPFLCVLAAGEPRPLSARQLAWVSPINLSGYRFPAANDVLIRSLSTRLILDHPQSTLKGPGD